MTKLYKKNELTFAIVCIVIYVITQSAANPLSEMIGVQKSAHAIFSVLMTVIFFCFFKKNDLFKYYRFCKPNVPARRFIWYIPLILISSHNLWLGVSIGEDIPAIVCDSINMLCVGILEEIIFRGLLFNAMVKDGEKAAIIVSSATFGLGHIMNLINGSGSEVLPTLCQMVYAVAIGFLFVMIYYRGGSIIPCIIAHSTVDVASVFGNWESVLLNADGTINSTAYILNSLGYAAFVVIYTLILLKTLPKKSKAIDDN